MRKPRKANGARCLYLLVALLVHYSAPRVWAQEVSPELLQSIQEAYERQQQEEPKIFPAAHVDPNLLSKKVVVHCRDGRKLKGKLVDLRPEFIRLERRGRVEEIPLNEIEKVNRQRNRARLTWIIVGASAATVGAILFFGATYWDD